MKKFKIPGFLVLLALISSCTINPLLTPGSGGTGAKPADDILIIANQVLKSSLQMDDIGTNAIRMCCIISIPSKPSKTDYEYSFHTNFVYSVSLVGGEGSLTVDCDFGRQINLSILGTTNFEVYTIGGVIGFDAFKIGKMTSPVDGVLTNELIITNFVNTGSVFAYYGFEGNLSVGGTNFSLSCKADASSALVTIFRECNLNGFDWVPELD